MSAPFLADLVGKPVQVMLDCGDAAHQRAFPPGTTTCSHDYGTKRHGHQAHVLGAYVRTSGYGHGGGGMDTRGICLVVELNGMLTSIPEEFVVLRKPAEKPS